VAPLLAGAQPCQQHEAISRAETTTHDGRRAPTSTRDAMQLECDPVKLRALKRFARDDADARESAVMRSDRCSVVLIAHRRYNH
jgi:hypothetical protein